MSQSKEVMDLKQGVFIESSMEKQLSDMTSSLNNPGKNIDLLSQISEEARLPLVRIMLKAEIRGAYRIQQSIESYLRLGVSINRLGRQESVGILEKILINFKEMLSSLKDQVKDHV